MSGEFGILVGISLVTGDDSGGGEIGEGCKLGSIVRISVSCGKG